VDLGIQTNRLSAERDLTRLEAERAEATTGFLLDLFDLAGESGGRDTLTVGALLDRGEDRLNARVGDHPLLPSDLLGALATANDRVGLDHLALRLLERKVEVLQEHYGREHLETLRAAVEVGVRRTAARHLSQAVELYSADLGPEHIWTARARTGLAECLMELGRLDEAERTLLEARPALLQATDRPVSVIRKNLELLVRLYDGAARPKDAEGYRALLADLDGVG
jgi:tetratricopeptide (TPR) repeat protein